MLPPGQAGSLRSEETVLVQENFLEELGWKRKDGGDVPQGRRGRMQTELTYNGADMLSVNTSYEVAYTIVLRTF